MNKPHRLLRDVALPDGMELWTGETIWKGAGGKGLRLKLRGEFARLEDTPLGALVFNSAPHAWADVIARRWPRRHHSFNFPACGPQRDPIP